MGVVKGIDYDHFPKQSEMVSKQVRVCFHYDGSRTLPGTVIRDDTEAPFVMLIQLDDGRVVLATECMWGD